MKLKNMIKTKKWMRKIYNEFGKQKQLQLFEDYLENRIIVGIDSKLNRKKELRIYNKLSLEEMNIIIEEFEAKYHLCYKL